MLPPRGIVEAAPGERMDAVAGRMEQILNPTVLVVDDGRLVGVIEPEDLTRYMTTGTKLTPRAGG
jgi:predicted transcriptional regulator